MSSTFDDDADGPSILQSTLDILDAALTVGRAGEGRFDAEARHDLRLAAGILKRCAGRLNRRVTGGAARPVLTPRERVIARLLARGCSYKDICAELDVSLASVQGTVKTVYLKLGVHSRGELQAMFSERVPT